MAHHRAVRRLGIVLAVPVVLLLIPVFFFLNSPKASAAPAPGVSAISVGCTGAPDWRFQITWSISASPADTGTRYFSAHDLVPFGATLDVNKDNFTTTSIVMTLPAGYTSGHAEITVDVHYVTGDPPVEDVGAGSPVSKDWSATCAAPPPTTAATTTRAATSRPASTTRAASVAPPVTTTSSALPTTASASPTDVLAILTGTTGAPVAAGGGGGGKPSFILIIATFLILLAFLIALIFLLRERRALKRERDDGDDDEYWDEYRAGYR